MITAALPTYNNSNIIWLQLTALCSQIDAPDWELIVIEEDSENTLGLDGLRSWREKLKKANCKRIVYVHLSEWVPLGQKWIIARDNMHKDSVGLMLCASDNFSPWDRIKISYEAMLEGNEWFQFNSGHFYNIVDHKAGVFKAAEGSPALFMCVSTEAVNRVNENIYPRKGVDTWLMRHSLPRVTRFDKWTDGIHTDGYNTISFNRRLQYANDDQGLFKTVAADKVLATFPECVQTKLKLMRK